MCTPAHARLAFRTPSPLLLAALVLLGLALAPSAARAQEDDEDLVFGIWIDPAGSIRFDARSARAELEKVRRARPAPASAAPEQLTYASLARAIAAVRAAREAGEEPPEGATLLNGLTQVRYVLVYPEANDIVLAGPGDEADDPTSLLPRGKASGRPLVRFDDLVVALRLAAGQRAMRIGCSIDPPLQAAQRAQQAMKDVGTRDRRALADAVAAAMGPQQVRQFGPPPDSRMALACVAADYQLKRYIIALDALPVAGIGHPVDASRVAANGYWFESSYEPLLVSDDGLAFEVRGPRLKLLAGQVPFDPRGATERAQAWAKAVSAKMPQLAHAIPLWADLQNVSDAALVASLIRRQRLAERAGLDLSWLLDEANYRPRPVRVPRQTDTLTNYAGGSLAAGGVSLTPDPFAAQGRTEKDSKGALRPFVERGAQVAGKK